MLSGGERSSLGFWLLCLTVGCAEPASEAVYQPASACEGCHPDHSREWRGSIMHYAAASPVFNAMELAVRELSNGLVAADGEQKNFCSKCHSPISHYRDELPKMGGPTAFESMSEVGRDGVSCDVCHSVVGPDVEGSIAKDGLANLSLLFDPGTTKRGTFDDPAEAAPHGGVKLDYLRSSEFCGSCHDVRFPKADASRREPFQRVENLFTEWAGSSFAFRVDRDGDAISCQDCHMSLYPITRPGVYPEALVGVGATTKRRHAMHAFTAVSAPLVDDPEFPNVDTDEVDRFGYPLGQEQRRRLMLRAACTVRIVAPESITAAHRVLRALVTVTNVGAGHAVPSGFSEERQVWLHVVARDESGVLYESGYLTDRAHPETGEHAPDGRLDDEPLEDVFRTIDPNTLEEHTTPGPDVDLTNFQNAFIKFDEFGIGHDVLNPLAADIVDDSRSLLPDVPRTSIYDIPIERPIVGDVEISVVLRYRTFPPELMRALAIRYPHLLSEATVDKNKIVDMAEARRTVSVTP